MKRITYTGACDYYIKGEQNLYETFEELKEAGLIERDSQTEEEQKEEIESALDIEILVGFVECLGDDCAWIDIIEGNRHFKIIY